MRITSEELKARISQQTYNNQADFYKSIRHSLLADVVNPHNFNELYGEGTRIARWTTYKHGFPLGKAMAFPPLKEGEPMSEREKKAWERIDEDKKTYFTWRSQQRPVGYYKSSVGKKLKAQEEAQKAAAAQEEAQKAAQKAAAAQEEAQKAAQKAAAAQEAAQKASQKAAAAQEEVQKAAAAQEEAQKAQEEAQKAPKKKKKMMIIEGKNLPNRSFHLFKNLLTKNKNCRIAKMNKKLKIAKMKEKKATLCLVRQ